MAKSILVFDGPFDERKSLAFVTRSRRERHFGKPEPVQVGQTFRVMYEKGARAPYAVYRHRSWDRYILRRSASEARLSADDCYAFTIVESGTKKIRQANRELIVEAGQSALLPMNSGYVIEHIPPDDGPYKSKYIYLPDFNSGHLTGFSKQMSLINLSADELRAADNILNLLLENGDFFKGDTCRSLTQELNRLIFRDVRQSDLRANPNNRHQKICAAVESYLSEHFSDPSLNSDIVAGALGISKRTLFYALDRFGLSFSKLMWEQRVSIVKHWLSKEAMAQTPLKQIAFSAGFKSAAHLSVKFRKSMKCSPSDFRNSTPPS